MMFFFEFNTRFRLKTKIRRSAINLNITMRYIRKQSIDLKLLYLEIQIVWKILTNTNGSFEYKVATDVLCEQEIYTAYQFLLTSNHN